jgi:hypothetical protein
VSGGGAPGAGAGAALVPAAVVNPVPPPSVRSLTPDAQAAAMLAWRLQRDCSVRGLVVDWALGVFRSERGGAPSETVVISSEGSGYVPQGVYVPCGVGLLVADRYVVDESFRGRWFGWRDPAEVLVEYARLRLGDGWSLVAAASTGKVDALRTAGVAHPDRCTHARNPFREVAPAVLDERHVHRLQLEDADLYERLSVMAGEADQARVEAVMLRLAYELVSLARGLDDPGESVCDGPELGPRQQLLEAWQQISGTHSGAGTWDEERWHEYRATANMQFGLTSVKAATDGPDHHYRQKWLLSRAMEYVGCWAERPLPLADMVYAALAVGLRDVRVKVDEAVAALGSAGEADGDG